MAILLQHYIDARLAAKPLAAVGLNFAPLSPEARERGDEAARSPDPVRSETGKDSLMTA